MLPIDMIIPQQVEYFKLKLIKFHNVTNKESIK